MSAYSNIDLKDRPVQVLRIYLEEKLSLARHVKIIGSGVVASSVYGLCKLKRFLSRILLHYFANLRPYLLN